ncbi:carbon-nitrogen hydrolase family protein [Acidiphilium sp. AL]|uniref:Carbon-nitrogen hydrolase family protein n=1 Tax=Acidiphilium iwatense TaxID=768198 RepID=A0ABS9DYX4_9PROT|nr:MULTISPECIES: carbon-nitrogen hydrolase family protein [Acidiphilium]MCF3947941.1 carbon-nitrogen hydrolase family protein [Acidiphilium iwatense]MCU4160946.1 carbon-nitrogen hydrolase family protein [Acidiphilium sp. AL]
MQNDPLRLTVIQMAPGADKSANIEQARGLIEAAIAQDRPHLIALPEIWTCLGGNRAAKFAAAEILPPEGSNEAGGVAYEFLRAIARRHEIHVHGGSIGELSGEKLFNTTIVFDPGGREIARYRKIHLFDITTPDGQGYRESAVYGAGEQVVTAQIGALTVGLTICYDMRFPELYLSLRRAGADLIMVPAAFTLQTGKDHWEVLLRARAIETQCWIAAPACTGTHYDGSNEPRVTYGNSLIADPWGHVVARVSDGPGFATARIDAARIARVRRDMPVLDHRKLA